MKARTGPTTTEVGKPVVRPGYLVQIDFSSIVRVSTSGDRNWNSFLWAGADLKVAITNDGKGLQSARLDFFDSVQAIASVVLTEGVSDKRVRIWRFYGDALAAGDPELVFDGYGDDYDAAYIRSTITATTSGSRVLLAPRTYITKAQGFNFLPAAGTRVQWNGETLVLEPSESVR